MMCRVPERDTIVASGPVSGIEERFSVIVFSPLVLIGAVASQANPFRTFSPPSQTFRPPYTFLFSGLPILCLKSLKALKAFSIKGR
jgi:hypothetical protein